jgi:hypothetical protein
MTSSEDQRQEERRTGSRRRVDRHRTRNNRLFGVFFVVCVVIGYISLQSAVNSIKTNRVEGVQQRCELTKTLLDTLLDAHAPTRLAARLNRTYDQCEKSLAQAKKDAN